MGFRKWFHRLDTPRYVENVKEPVVVSWPGDVPRDIHDRWLQLPFDTSNLHWVVAMRISGSVRNKKRPDRMTEAEEGAIRTQVS